MAWNTIPRKDSYTARDTIAVIADKVTDGVDVRNFDTLALLIKATRNSGTETLTVYREEALDGGNFMRMEQVTIFDGAGLADYRFDLRRRLWRLAFVPSAAPCDYSLEINFTVRTRRGKFIDLQNGTWLEV